MLVSISSVLSYVRILLVGKVCDSSTILPIFKRHNYIKLVVQIGILDDNTFETKLKEAVFLIMNMMCVYAFVYLFLFYLTISLVSCVLELFYF